MLPSDPSPIPENREYALNRRATRLLLDAAMDGYQFTAFCTDYFQDIQNEFTDGQDKAFRIQLLLQRVWRDGRAEMLVALLRADYPQKYADFEAALRTPPISFPSLPMGSASPPAANAAPEQAGAERIVHQELEFRNVVAWRDTMKISEQAVCRIETWANKPGGRVLEPQGTGFLVGEGLILTCWHVLLDLLEAGRGEQAEPDAPQAAFVARFDYKQGAAGDTSLPQGTLMVPVTGQPWRVSASPEAGLDYVLARVAAAPEGTAAARKPLIMPARHVFTQGEPMQILQHPKAEPMKYAAGWVSQPSGGTPDAPRLLHQVNTLAGSSGAPCFTMDWEPVALHQGYEGAQNRAVPLASIRADILLAAPQTILD